MAAAYPSHPVIIRGGACHWPAVESPRLAHIAHAQEPWQLLIPVLCAGLESSHACGAMWRGAPPLPWNFHRISFCLNARVTNQKICLSYPSCLKCILLCYPREIRPKNDEFVICQTFFLLLKFFLKFSFQKVLSVLIRFEFFIVILLTHCLVLCSRALAKIAKCIPECFHYLMLSCSSRFSVCPECIEGIG